MRRALAIAISIASCGGESSAPAPIDRARERFPAFIDLHQQVIARTCSPNRGVCHNSSNHPDLSTPANVLDQIGAPCNLEIPEPSLGWDDCERSADRAVTAELWTEIAWSDPIAPGRWRFELRDAATVTATRTVRFEHASGEVALDLAEGPDRERATLEIALHAGAHTATVSVRSASVDVSQSYDAALAGIVQGDPNRNGTFGAERGARASLIEPGVLARSYLWRRIAGTVPGSRMPLANQPLSVDEYVAIACWIDELTGGSTVDAAIDFEGCSSIAVEAAEAASSDELEDQ